MLVFVDADGDGPGLPTLDSRLLYGSAIDQVFATESATGDVLWALSDHQGTVRDWAAHDSGTDTTSVINHLAYDSYGNITEVKDGDDVATTLDIQLSAFLPAYTGREWDADSDLYYFRKRSPCLRINPFLNVERFQLRNKQIGKQIDERLTVVAIAEVRPLGLVFLAPVEKRIDDRRHGVARRSRLLRLHKQLLVLLEGRVFVRPQVVLNPIQGDVPQPA